MSGIIHINGKNYDEEGNLIVPKSQPVKFVDGITAQKIETPALKTTPLSNLSPNKPPTIINRTPIKPPTMSTQKSQTLLRSVVQKPNDIIPSGRPAVIMRKPAPSIDPVMHAKHSQVQRLAKVPAVSSQSLPTQKSQPSFTPRKKTEEMIQAQLEAATAHLMTFKKPRLASKIKKKLDSTTPFKRKFLLSSASSLSMVMLAGIIVYANLAGISLLIANKRAGFTAYLPSYTPNGYQIKNPIGYTSGRIILNFESNSNDMNYTIEQKPSGWNSETLREQVSASNGNQFQTQYINGLTVYFTNENDATWVDRGVIFTLHGESGLSSEQIASIAASM